MELLTHGVQTIPFDAFVALPAGGGEEPLIAVLAMQRPLLLHEAHVEELLAARGGRAAEVVGAPVLAEGGHEWSSDLNLTVGTHRYSRCYSLVHNSSASLGRSSFAGNSFCRHSSNTRRFGWSHAGHGAGHGHIPPKHWRWLGWSCGLSRWSNGALNRRCDDRIFFGDVGSDVNIPCYSPKCVGIGRGCSYRRT